MTLPISPGPLGPSPWLPACLLAAGALALTAGLRAWRLRRVLVRLRPATVAESAPGPACVRGRVVVDEPLVSPLSSRPCAGWRLEVRGVQTRVGARIQRQVDFRIESGGREAVVDAQGARWKLAVTAERRFAAGEALPEGTLATFAAEPDIAWLRGLGIPLVVTERALFTGLEAHVVGVLGAHAVAAAPVEQLRTGTDATAWALAPESPARVHLSAREPFGTLLVSAGEPDVASLAPPGWQVAGVVAGPVLALLGLFQLALLALGGGR